MLTDKCRIPNVTFMNVRETITCLLDGDKLGSQLKGWPDYSLLKTGGKNFTKKKKINLFENLKVELAEKTCLPFYQKTIHRNEKGLQSKNMKNKVEFQNNSAITEIIDRNMYRN